MKQLTPLFIAVFYVSVSDVALSASFNYNQALTKTELAICDRGVACFRKVYLNRIAFLKSAEQSQPVPKAPRKSTGKSKSASEAPVTVTKESDDPWGWIIILGIAVLWLIVKFFNIKQEKEAIGARLSKYLVESVFLEEILAALASKYIAQGRAGNIVSLDQFLTERFELVGYGVFRVVRSHPEFASMEQREIKKCESKFLEIDMKPGLAKTILDSISSEFSNDLSLTETDKSMLDNIASCLDENLRPVFQKRLSQMLNITAIKMRQFDRVSFVSTNLSVRLSPDEKVIFWAPQTSLYYLDEMEVSTTEGSTLSIGQIATKTLSGIMGGSNSSSSGRASGLGISYGKSEGVISTTGTIASKTITLKEEHLRKVESGDLIVTTQKVWFVGPNRVLNIKFSDIVRQRVFAVGVLINKIDEQKPLVFKSKTMDGWLLDVSLRVGAFIN